VLRHPNPCDSAPPRSGPAMGPITGVGGGGGVWGVRGGEGAERRDPCARQR
jgi:hypothetical protein